MKALKILYLKQVDVVVDQTRAISIIKATVLDCVGGGGETWLQTRSQELPRSYASRQSERHFFNLNLVTDASCSQWIHLDNDFTKVCHGDEALMNGSSGTGVVYDTDIALLLDDLARGNSRKQHGSF